MGRMRRCLEAELRLRKGWERAPSQEMSRDTHANTAQGDGISVPSAGKRHETVKADSPEVKTRR